MRNRVPFSAYLFNKYEGVGGHLEFIINPDAKGWSSVRQVAALDSEGIMNQAKAM